MAEAIVANPSVVVGGNNLSLRAASVSLSRIGGVCVGPVSGVSSDIQMALAHIWPLY